MDGFDWGAIWYAAPYMAKGALVTLEISSCAMALATLVGVVMGLVSASDLKVLKSLVRVYVYFIRGTPALVLGMDLLTQFETVSLDFGRSQVRFDIAGPQGLQALQGKVS